VALLAIDTAVPSLLAAPLGSERWSAHLRTAVSDAASGDTAVAAMQTTAMAGRTSAERFDGAERV
jgi:hypothetical protein